jgi:hypothetical protein
VLRDINGSGFRASGLVEATLDLVNSSGNITGVQVEDGPHVMVTNSVLANNVGEGVLVTSSGAFQSVSDVTVTHTTISSTPFGFVVSATPGNTSRIVSDANVITEVATSAFDFINNGGTEIILSPGNNTIGFNNGIVTGGSLTTPCCSH